MKITSSDINDKLKANHRELTVLAVIATFAAVYYKGKSNGNTSIYVAMNDKGQIVGSPTPN